MTGRPSSPAAGRATRARALAVVRVLPGLVLLVVVGGCSGSDAPAARAPVPTTSAAASQPAAAPVTSPRVPVRNACYRLRAAALTRPTNAREPVPCGSRHTTRTILVGQLDLVVKGHALAVDSMHAGRELARRCPAAEADYVGGTARRRSLSRFEVVWFSPTLAEADRGAGWFRCDLVLFGVDAQPARLPQGDLHGVLRRRAALDRFGLCGTAAPGTAGFHRVLCGRRHSWRAVTTIPLRGGAAYPGAAAVRRAGDGDCADEVRARRNFTLEFTYGWEWPTREQWAAGQRFGYCWAPEP